MRVIQSRHIFEASINEDNTVSVKDQNGNAQSLSMSDFSTQFLPLHVVHTEAQAPSITLRFVTRILDGEPPREARILQQRVGDGEWEDVPTVA